MKLRYTDRAKDNIEIAVLWYEKQKIGLGFEFFDCIKDSEEKIKKQPKMYAVSYSFFRGCIVKRFPIFNLLYN